jgi:hypothetical protein
MTKKLILRGLLACAIAATALAFAPMPTVKGTMQLSQVQTIGATVYPKVTSAGRCYFIEMVLPKEDRCYFVEMAALGGEKIPVTVLDELPSPTIGPRPTATIGPRPTPTIGPRD